MLEPLAPHCHPPAKGAQCISALWSLWCGQRALHNALHQRCLGEICPHSLNSSTGVWYAHKHRRLMARMLEAVSGPLQSFPQSPWAIPAWPQAAWWPSTGLGLALPTSGSCFFQLSPQEITSLHFLCWGGFLSCIQDWKYLYAASALPSLQRSGEWYKCKLMLFQIFFKPALLTSV